MATAETAAKRVDGPITNLEDFGPWLTAKESDHPCSQGCNYGGTNPIFSVRYA